MLLCSFDDVTITAPLVICRCSDFASYRRRGHFSHAGCEAYHLWSWPSLISISPTAAFTRKKQICGNFGRLCHKSVSEALLWILCSIKDVFCLTLNSVCKETMTDVIGERWEDVTSCCRRPCAHLTSACTWMGAAVFGDLVWVRKRGFFCYFHGQAQLWGDQPFKNSWLNFFFLHKCKKRIHETIKQQLSEYWGNFWGRGDKTPSAGKLTILSTQAAVQRRVLGILVVHRETDVGSRLSAPTAGSFSCYTVIIGLLSIIKVVKNALVSFDQIIYV